MRRIVAALVLAASGSASLAAASCPMAWTGARAGEAAPLHATGHRHDATATQKSGAPVAPAHVHAAGARHDAPNGNAPDRPDRSCAPTMACGAVAAAAAPPAALATSDAAAAPSPPTPRRGADAALAHDPPPPRLLV